MTRKTVLQFVVKSLLICMGYTWCCSISAKPNIVWIMAEDIGADLACYGTKGLQTPNLDKMAQEGLRLTRAYTTNPICSPSRSSMMTGMHQNSIDTHNHRSHRGDGYKLPNDMETLTYLLRQAGYYVSNGNGYNNKTDLNFNLRNRQKPLFDSKNWKNRQPGQPFYGQITLYKTHRNNTSNNWENIRANSTDPVDPAKVEVPPYLPDRQEVRYDWALYLDQMEHVDGQVGAIIKRLADEGELDNTMVIFIGDNGRCQIRGKGYLYEDGIHVPAIIRYPGKVSPGTESDELVPMIDMVAQILHEAGVTLPSYMQGRPFLESSVPDREFVFAARDRWDEIMDKSRTVIGKRFKLIRNDMALVPYDANQGYLNNSGVRPILPLLRTMAANGQLNAVQAQFFKPQKPNIQLFDLENDPWEITNLADNPAHKDLVDSLMKKLTQWEHEANDRGRIPEDSAVLDKTMKPRFYNNAHMQKIIKLHKIKVTIEGQGSVSASYSGLKDIPANMMSRYGFEIYLDAKPGTGNIVDTIFSDDIKGSFDALKNRYTFFMPLKDVSINVIFGPPSSIQSSKKSNSLLGKVQFDTKTSRLIISKGYGATVFRLYDVSGRVVKATTNIEKSIHLNNLSKGIYLYTIDSNERKRIAHGRIMVSN